MKDKNYDIDKYIKGREKSEKRKKLQRSVRKEKPRQKSKRPRQNDWSHLDEDAWDEFEGQENERIMPRGEQERRRTLERKVFEDEGEAEEEQADLEIAEGQQSGLVIEVSAGRCRVQLEDEVILCELRGALLNIEEGFSNPIAVGDEVLLSVQDDGSGVVEGVQPRRSALVRQGVGQRPQKHIIAANLDQLLIVAAWRQPHFWPELVDRYLIAAERNELAPILCINKLDLLAEQSELDAELWPYRQLDVPILLTSAQNGQGIQELQKQLAGKVTALAGLSGVGKSSLLNAAYPHLELRTGAVSDDTLQGRHTTTQATLIQLDDESTVIDTPGIREFGLAGLRKGDLVAYYPELAELAGGCKYSNCAHQDEPDCAVKAAVESGEVAESRFASYLKIQAELPD